jgi:hypothetical protein
MYPSNNHAKGPHIIELKLSTIDFIERRVALFFFSIDLLVMVSSIGRIKSSIKL